MQGTEGKPSTTNNTEEPHPIDVYVGKRVRYFRMMKGMRQRELAGLAGVNFQQIHKYESAANRISASKLYLICEALDITLIDFFAGLYEEEGEAEGEEAILPPAFSRMRPKKRKEFIEVMGQIAELVASK